MNSKQHFMTVALWILATAAVAADKPPQPAANPSCRGAKGGEACVGTSDAARLFRHIEQTLEERS